MKTETCSKCRVYKNDYDYIGGRVVCRQCVEGMSNVDMVNMLMASSGVGARVAVVLIVQALEDENAALREEMERLRNGKSQAKPAYRERARA